MLKLPIKISKLPRIVTLSLVPLIFWACSHCAELAAESSLEQGDIIYSISGGRGKPHKLLHDSSDTVLLKAEGVINLSSPVYERQVLGFRQLTMENGDGSASSNGSLIFEYIYSRKFSIRAGLSRFKAVFDNVSTIDYQSHLLQAYDYAPPQCGSPLLHSHCKNAPVARHELYTIQQTWLEFKPLLTVDLGFDFHLPLSTSLDPYIGFGVGRSVQAGKTMKTDFHAGIRYFFGGGFSLGMEAFVRDYLGPQRTRLMQDRGANISMGFRVR